MSLIAEPKLDLSNEHIKVAMEILEESCTKAEKEYGGTYIGETSPGEAIDLIGQKVFTQPVRTYIHSANYKWPYGPLLISNRIKVPGFHVQSELGQYIDSLNCSDIQVEEGIQWFFPDIGECPKYSEFRLKDYTNKSGSRLRWGHDLNMEVWDHFDKNLVDTITFDKLPRTMQKSAYIQTGVRLSPKYNCPLGKREYRGKLMWGREMRGDNYPYSSSWKEFGQVGTAVEILTSPGSEVSADSQVWEEFLEKIWKPYSYAMEWKHLDSSPKLSWCHVASMEHVNSAIAVSAPKCAEIMQEHADGMYFDKKANVWTRGYMT
jgi:hypothetical protein